MTQPDLIDPHPLIDEEVVTNLIGKTFHYWTVLRRIAVPPGKKPRYLCRCECGKEGVVVVQMLREGKSKSCGCYRNKKTGDRRRSHGLSKTTFYNKWLSMRARCNNPKSRAYPDYGGRGIKVCARWDDYTLFVADVAPTYQPGLQLDRIDNDKGYEPGNVRWVSTRRNCRNKRNTIMVEWAGDKVALIDLADRFGLNHDTVYARYRGRGWSLERSLGVCK